MALHVFCTLWKRRYGVSYAPTPADCGQLKVMLRGQRPEPQELFESFARYLADLDPFVAQVQRHSLKFFCTSGGFNKYRAVAPILTTREATNAAAGEQWLDLHGQGRNGVGGK